MWDELIMCIICLLINIFIILCDSYIFFRDILYVILHKVLLIAKTYVSTFIL